METECGFLEKQGSPGLGLTGACRAVAPAGEAAPQIGFLVGSDGKKGWLEHDANFKIEGITDLHRLRDRELDDWIRVHVPPNYGRQAWKYDLRPYDLLLNLVTDADQHPRVLAAMTKLLKGHGGRVLNRPELVARTTRDQMAGRLEGIEGLTVPRVARFFGNERAARAAISRAEIAFPAILRPVGTHAGNIVGLVESVADAVALLKPRSEYFLTQFHDVRDADGLYRKMRVFFIGGVPIIRHGLASDRWSVHASDRFRFVLDRPELIAQEQRLVSEGFEALPQVTRAALMAMNARIGLDFFGADLALAPDGGLTLFEANATMNFFPLAQQSEFAYLAVAQDRAVRAYEHLLYPLGAPQQRRTA